MKCEQNWETPLYKEFWKGDGGDVDENGLKFKVMYVLNVFSRILLNERLYW